MTADRVANSNVLPECGEDVSLYGWWVETGGPWHVFIRVGDQVVEIVGEMTREFPIPRW